VPEDNSELYGLIQEDLEDRQRWEGRQIIWNRMRNQGVGRHNRPWPGAANAHVPIADTIISKLKPYYIVWIFGPELLASFYSLDRQGDSYTDSVAQWFDYKVRECSNFSEQTVCAVDSCLQNGMGILKPYWDPLANSIAFASVHPYFVIVPFYSTFDFNRADRVVHVMQYSVDEYLRDAELKGFNADETYVESITGEGKPDKKYERQRYLAEGLSYSNLKNLIVLWEVYLRDSDGQLTVKTFSPLQPDEPAREDFKLPYEHRQVPLVMLPYELTDGGYYSNRGVCELVQMYEASACKTWNEKLDFMSIANRPVLSTQGGSINAQNIRWEPGAVYDSVLQLVQQPTPPVSFDTEMASVRSMAEQRVGIPDFGVAGPDQAAGSGNKTATETNVITNVMQQSNDLRARILKGAVTRVFEQAWSLLKQYDRASLDYFWRKERRSLEDAAFDNKYLLKPNGSVDGYSREREIQKLMQLRQLSQGSPWIVTPQIDRKLIELMDAQWVGDLYQEPQDLSSDQQQKQAIENSIMSDGFLPQVKPDDDHLVHLQMEEGFIGWSQANGRPIAPPQMGTFMQHMAAHIQAARGNPQYWKQYGAQIMPFIAKLKDTQKQLMQAQQAAQAAQGSLSALRGGAPPGMGGPPGAGAMPPGMPSGAAVPKAAGPPPPPQPGMPAGVPATSPNGAGGLPMV
jgi:hypothetical protein